MPANNVPLVALLNSSTVLTDDQVQAVVASLQAQVSNDFAPIWHADARLQFFPKSTPPPEDAWWLVVLDNSDQADQTGYHDTTHEGLPAGKVYANTDLQSGHSWTTTASHELLELLADPWINLAAVSESPVGGKRLFAYEACDPCESDEFGYKSASGVLLSDFVTPAWFSRGAKGPYDFQGHITQPLTVITGGYIGVLDVGQTQGWTQMTADIPTAATIPPWGSRRERRHRARFDWAPSQPKDRQMMPPVTPHP